ncbi:dinitrogenase iron-molybdenum cofactor [candidate division WOR-3 bacterium]|uniref:Dinitrogenase iron-molybdenum cofactor n=1 Tax=candidate division WOR-3 bacterium TaxID=2052148 RepID=A0A660SHL0_UNCW3|nr:MAG: dinitrogenase iron-molybdenum cofactor [candidate division WOR-3 bacterium]
MKAAIATEGSRVAQHFGRCPHFTIVEIEGGSVISQERVVNPRAGPGSLPQFLKSQGIGLIICGGMGERAQVFFKQMGIDIILGVTGTIDEVVDNLTAGKLSGGKSLCPKGGGETVEPCDGKEER